MMEFLLVGIRGMKSSKEIPMLDLIDTMQRLLGSILMGEYIHAYIMNVLHSLAAVVCSKLLAYQMITI